MEIKIYQIKSLDKCNYSFMGWRFAKNEFNISDYELIYDCERNYTNPDEVYEEFNINRPENFTGHSLSVSDVITMGDKIYYCDSFGWTNITNDID